MPSNADSSSSSGRPSSDASRAEALAAEAQPTEKALEATLRPTRLGDFVGQEKNKENLQVFMTAALRRGDALDHTLLFGPPGLGKCITADSLVLTEQGLVRFRDVIPGDLAAGESRPLSLRIFGMEGLEPASHVYASGRRPTRRITTRSGFTLEGTLRHPVRVATPAGPQWKPLGALAPGDHVALGRGMETWGNTFHTTWLPTPSAGFPPAPQTAHRGSPNAEGISTRVQTRPAALPAPPPARSSRRRVVLDPDVGYLLGALIGNGRWEQGTGFPAFVIPCAPLSLRTELRRIGHRCFGTRPHLRARGRNREAAEMRFGQDIGAACRALLGYDSPAHPCTDPQPAEADRAVPAAVLTSPREVAVGFLQGLFDTGGRVRPRGVEWGTRSEGLAQQVQLLLANLGIIAARHESERGRAPSWMLTAEGRDAARFLEEVGFRLDRKQARGASLHNPKRQAPESHGRNRSSLAPGALPTLCTLTAPHVFWDPVTEIESGEAETFDFVVPGTHSFMANGFYNHNTTLAHIIAEEMGAKIITTSGPVLEKPASIAGVLTNLEEGDVLFIDEIHRLTSVVEEYLYSAMEDYRIDILIDSGPNARTVQITLPPFTLVGATTRKGLLTAPLRARFGIDLRFDYYPATVLQKIVARSAGILSVDITGEGAHEIARRSRGTPRVANRLLRRTRDFAEVEGEGVITEALADHALGALNVDEEGLDDMDARILLTLIENFGGGPTGLNNLAVSVGEEAGTIEEVYEPYLIQEGFLERTPRGRMATERAYRHFDLSPPEGQDLFD